MSLVKLSNGVSTVDKKRVQVMINRFY